MAIVTITEAAELAGVSRGTLYNRLKDGTLSRSGDGVDTAELLRVFGALKATSAPERMQSAPDKPDVSERVGEGSRPPAGVTDGPDAALARLMDAHLDALERERVWLRGLVEAERAKVAERDAQIASLTERITALLPAPETSPPRRPLWRRVFGG